MVATAEHDPMAKKKKSEVRKHTAMLRVDEEARELATKAASLMGMSLADYASAVLKKTADRDLFREAKKITGEGEK
jgi:predicted HicB family RNase H-like nuclease